MFDPSMHRESLAEALCDPMCHHDGPRHRECAKKADTLLASAALATLVATAQAGVLAEVERRLGRERDETFDLESEPTWTEAIAVVRSVAEGQPLRAADTIPTPAEDR